MSALARELEEARKRAGDAEAEAYALRAKLTATERERDEACAGEARFAREIDSLRHEHDNLERDLRKKGAWRLDKIESLAIERDEARAVIAAACTALGESATGDLARDVAGLVATLREHEIALARATEVGVRLGLEAAAADFDRRAMVMQGEADELARAARVLDAGAVRRRASELQCEARSVRAFADDAACIARGALKPAPQPETLQLPETPATEAPHAVGDVWRNAHGEGTVTGVVEAGREGGWFECRIALDYGHLSRVDEWRDDGWRRIRCASEAAAAPAKTAAQCAFCGDAVTCRDCRQREAAVPAVGDPVRVRLDGRAAVDGRVGREPEAGSAQAFRVEAAGHLEVYGRAADIEVIDRGEAK